ncbi:MAG: hypothetical protein QG670_2078 [Thermoproteota archaeon]|nr:hypothetical protein [Thermoproteota archaeon]
MRLTVILTLKIADLNAEATPRLDAGTDPIIELMFGEPKMLPLTPKIMKTITIVEYGVVILNVERRYKETQVITNPIVVKGMVPYLSESFPLSSHGQVRQVKGYQSYARVKWAEA